MAVLTGLERKLAMDLARQVMPARGSVQARDQSSLERFEEMLETAPAGLKAGIRAALLLFRVGSGLESLAGSKGDQVGRWLQSDVIRRNLLRAVLIPLKISAMSDPSVYASLGCSYGVDPPKDATTPRWWSKVVASESMGPGEEIEADVVVIGTGAGGGAAAKAMAEAGLAVAMIEEGKYFTRKDFDGRPAQMQRKLYRGLGMTVSAGNAIVYLPMGKTVGGSTTVNSGTCMRTPRRKLEAWVKDLGLDSLKPDRLEPYLDRVEEFLGVAEASRDILGGNARIVARGADAFGLQHGPLRRNAPECEGAGLCPFGCPTGAKRSVDVTYVPAALRSNAYLYTGVKAEKVLVDGGRAVGVRARSARGQVVVFRARAVVVAAGSLFTPLLLKRSGLKNRWIGRNLSIHPSGQVTALMSERVDGFDGIPQGYQFVDPKMERVRFEGVSTPLELLAGMLDLPGSDLMRFMDGYRNVSTFGFMIDDVSRGWVLGELDGWPIVIYNVRSQDLLNIKAALARLARVYLAAGAEEVYIPARGHRLVRTEKQVRDLEASDLRPGDLELGAFHPLGTCRLGASPRVSAVSPEFETWEVRGLYVADGSVVPGSLGANPQVTIMALATMAGDVLVGRLG